MNRINLKFVLLTVIVISLLGCGKDEPVVNYSANAINEFKNGKASNEVFEEDVFQQLTENKSETQKSIISEYVQNIQVVDCQITSDSMVSYTCTVLDASDIITNIINSEAFKTEIDKRNISQNFNGFEDFIYELALSDLPSCNTLTVNVQGYLNQDKLVSSSELFDPLVKLFATNIPTSYEEANSSSGEALDITVGDFVTKIDSNRILISNIKVMSGEEAVDAIKMLDAHNECYGLYVTFDATNLSKKEVIVNSNFYGVTDDYQLILPSNSVIGLHDTASLKKNETVSMDAYVVTASNFITWYTGGTGSYFYQWKEVEASE